MTILMFSFCSRLTNSSSIICILCFFLHFHIVFFFFTLSLIHAFMLELHRPYIRLFCRQSVFTVVRQARHTAVCTQTTAQSRCTLPPRQAQE